MFTSFSMFISSYAVLFALVGLRLDSGPARIIAFLVAAYGLLVALFAVFITPRAVAADPPKTVVALEDRGAEVAGYLVAYVLPFVMAPNPSASELIAYLAFLSVVGVIYARSSLLYLNPTIYLLCKRTVALKFDSADRRWMMVITSRDLRVGDLVSVRRLSANLAVESK
jgi:hypothetical protein